MGTTVKTTGTWERETPRSEAGRSRDPAEEVFGIKNVVIHKIREVGRVILRQIVINTANHH
jgi:hypothetical protein